MKPAVIHKIVTVVLFVLGSVTSLVYADGDNKGYIAQQVVVRVKAGSSVDSVLPLYNAIVLDSLPELRCYLLSTPAAEDAESLSTEIELEPEVEGADANYYVSAPEPVQSSQPFIDLAHSGTFTDQPAGKTLNLVSAHTMADGAAVRVGVLDGGIDFNHPVLQATTTSGYDYIDHDNISMDEPGGRSSGHGTFVAGVIKLVAPAAESRAYRVLDTAGQGSGFSIADAIVRAVSEGCKVINLSLVMTSPVIAIDAAIDYATAHDVIVVAAVGNDTSNVVRYPAILPTVLSVAAVDSLDQFARFSNFGPRVDICAPGVNIYAPYTGSQYAWWNGTIFAAPFVAGVASLLYQTDPGATSAGVRNIILGTGKNIDALNPEFVGKMGHGRLEVGAAITLCRNPICGDISHDWIGPDLSDLDYLIDYLSGVGPAPRNMKKASVTGSGLLPDISDIAFLVDYLSGIGPALLCTP